MRISRYADVLAELQVRDELPRPVWPFEQLPMVAPVFDSDKLDLIRDVAEPWALDLACRLTGATPVLEPLARQIFDSASEGATNTEATMQLAQCLAGEHMAMRVQAFVAISQTLPCFLGNAWLALIENPGQRFDVRGIEELLRFAGPSQAVMRGTKTLMLAEANRDPARFADPHRLDLNRDATGHLAFGSGAHACIGAAFIRTATACATSALLRRYSAIELAGPVEQRGGFAIRGVSSLPVVCVFSDLSTGNVC